MFKEDRGIERERAREEREPDKDKLLARATNSCAIYTLFFVVVVPCRHSFNYYVVVPI